MPRGRQKITSKTTTTDPAAPAEVPIPAAEVPVPKDDLLRLKRAEPLSTIYVMLLFSSYQPVSVR